MDKNMIPVCKEETAYICWNEDKHRLVRIGMETQEYKTVVKPKISNSEKYYSGYGLVDLFLIKVTYRNAKLYSVSSGKCVSISLSGLKKMVRAGSVGNLYIKNNGELDCSKYGYKSNNIKIECNFSHSDKCNIEIYMVYWSNRDYSKIITIDKAKNTDGSIDILAVYHNKDKVYTRKLETIGNENDTMEVIKELLRDKKRIDNIKAILMLEGNDE